MKRGRHTYITLFGVFGVFGVLGTIVRFEVDFGVAGGLKMKLFFHYESILISKSFWNIHS